MVGKDGSDSLKEMLAGFADIGRVYTPSGVLAVVS
jgi:hypothetical protein